MIHFLSILLANVWSKFDIWWLALKYCNFPFCKLNLLKLSCSGICTEWILIFFFIFILFIDGILKNEWHPKKLSTMNGFSPARIHHTITARWYTKNATIMVCNSQNHKPFRYSHCNRSHWKRKNISHRHRLLHHDNCIKHNRSSCRKWKAVINCIRIEPKVIKTIDDSLSVFEY